MKAVAVFLFSFALLGQITPDGPATTPNPDYPLKVEILLTKASASSRGANGFGRGNLLGPPKKGIDFTYECGTPFLNNGPTEFYQAKWKKPDQRLEILMERIGSTHLDKCDIDIAYKPAPYSLKR